MLGRFFNRIFESNLGSFIFTISVLAGMIAMLLVLRLNGIEVRLGPVPKDLCTEVTIQELTVQEYHNCMSMELDKPA